jgi:hypothetical protein
MRKMLVVLAVLAPAVAGMERSYGPLTVDYKGILSQHDVVYLTPPIAGHEGLILGDGEAGARLWNPPDRLVLQLNHSAFWNDSSPSPANDHGARVEIQTGLPMFDWKYLRDYEARQKLSEAEITLRAAGSMGRADVSAFYSKPHKVMVLTYRDRTRVPTARHVLLERFGSQYFGSFHARDMNPELNLGGTQAEAGSRELRIEQQLGSLRFAVVVVVDSTGPAPGTRRINNHQAEAAWEAAPESEFRLWIAMAHTGETGDPLQLARTRIEAARKAGVEVVQSAHRADWAEQWPRSFLYLPGDRYVENLWYLVMYQNIASHRGLEPPYFIDMIWNWKQDVKAWQTSLLHWNMFSPNFPLFAAGRLDLLEPYFRWKERQLPHAIQHAKRVHGVDGAAFTDFANFRGEQKLGGPTMIYNLTPGPQIAMEYYQYWQYSQDERFLKQRAMPFLRETARFYLNYLQKDAGGNYHVPRSNPYEFHGKFQFRDCITDLAHIRWLFPALIEAERCLQDVTELSARAEEALKNLAPFTPSAIHPDWLMKNARGDLVYENRFFKGDPYLSTDRVWATGVSLRDNRSVSHMEVGRDPSTLYGVLCGAPSAPAFPPGLVGPDSNPERRDFTGHNSPGEVAAWEAMRNALRTIRKFPPGLPADRMRHSDPDLSWTGHNLELPAFARLGLADNLKTALRTFIDKYQMYPMGLWCYWGWDAWKDAWHERRGADGSVIKFSSDPRILHASTEPTGIFAVTVQEMLMASFDGVVRVFPAYKQDATFGLHAVGGFFVTARQSGGNVEYVRVESRHGNPFTISSPWRDGAVDVREEGGRVVPFRRGKDRLIFATNADMAYLLKPAGATISPARLTDVPRDGAREFGRARLGKARDF